MAIQNFIAGGFKGKVGQIVGQGWKDKLIIRSYTVPANPNTPAQQASRAQFAKAVELSQQAMNINKGAEEWLNHSLTEWQWRVKTALGRLKRGMSDEDALPLFPDGMDPAIKLTPIQFTVSGSPRVISVSEPSYIFTEDRVINLTFKYFSAIFNDWLTRSVSLTVQAGNSLSYNDVWTESDVFPDGSWIEGASADDSTHMGRSIEIPRQMVMEAEKPTVIRSIAVSPNWNQTSSIVRLDFSCDAAPVFPTSAALTIYSQINGAWVITGNAGTVQFNNLGHGSLSIPWTYFNRFPSGSYVDGFSVQIETDILIYNFIFSRFMLTEQAVRWTFVITGVQFTMNRGAGNWSLSSSGPDFPTNRAVRINIYRINTQSNAWESVFFDGSVSAGGKFSFSQNLTDKDVFPTGSWVNIETSDDSSFPDLSIASGQIMIKEADHPIIPRSVSGTVSFNQAQNRLSASFTFAAAYQYPSNIPLTVYNRVNGTWGVRTGLGSITGISAGSGSANFLWDYYNRFPTNAYIEGFTADADRGLFSYRFTFNRLSVSEPATRWTLAITGLSFSFTRNTNTLYLGSTGPSLLTNRRFKVFIHYYEAGYEDWQTVELITTVNAGQKFSLTRQDLYSPVFPQGSWVKIQTDDDSSFPDLTINLAQTAIMEAVKPSINLHATVSAEWSEVDREVYIKLTLPFLNQDVNRWKSKVWMYKNGQWQTIENYYFYFYDENGYGCSVPWDFNNQLPQGAYLAADTRSKDFGVYSLIVSYDKTFITQPKVPPND